MNLSINPKFKMRALSRREKILAALLTLCAIVMLYQRFILAPQLNKINQLKSEITKQENVLTTRVEQGWTDIPVLQARAKEIQKEIDELYLKAPNIVDEPNLLVDFYQLAKLNGLQAEVIKFEPVQKVENYNYSTISIHLEVTGLNYDIYNFIAALEQYHRLDKIYSVTFEPQDATTSICSFSVEFYILGEIKPDPMDYPFMSGQYGKDKPHQMFNILIIETTENDGELTESNIEGTEAVPSQPVEKALEGTPTQDEATPNSPLPENDKTEWRWIPTFPGWIPADPRG
jgi:Tfp pilus assembly protein PilO